jgi:hypothetical protein
MSISLSNLRSLTYDSTTNIANFSGSVVVANNLGINDATPSYTLVVGGDLYTSGSILAPNMIYQFLRGFGSTPNKTYTAVNQIFGKNYDNSTVGYLAPYESVGVSNTVGSGWVDGNWYAPKTGRYFVEVHLWLNQTTLNNRWSLRVYNSSDVEKYNHIVHVEIATQNGSYSILSSYSMYLDMNSGDYFNVSLSNYVGGTTIYFGGTNHASIKVIKIA